MDGKASIESSCRNLRLNLKSPIELPITISSEIMAARNLLRAR